MLLACRFNGEVGDVVVGRITEVRRQALVYDTFFKLTIKLIYVFFFMYLQVQQKRWKVETNSRLDSVLLLSAVNLPGGELVRCLFCHPVGGGITSKDRIFF